MNPPNSASVSSGERGAVDGCDLTTSFTSILAPILGGCCSESQHSDLNAGFRRSRGDGLRHSRPLSLFPALGLAFGRGRLGGRLGRRLGGGPGVLVGAQLRL